MHWNWQQADWPHFTYDSSLLKEFERDFIDLSGQVFGAFKHLTAEKKDQLRVELIGEESLLTSKIEGENLDRDSIQSSIRRQLGLQVESIHKKPREEGISQMMMDVYFSSEEPLRDALLYRWHAQLFSGTTQEGDSGVYRTHPEPIQVVSGALYKPTVHFEAPPSDQVPQEMSQLIEWFNQAHLSKNPEPLAIAAITHLWFESIHPFPDGNGRVGRALVEYSLSKSLGRAAIISLSCAIERKRKDYYNALERSNKDNEILEWLSYFLPTLLEAQRLTLQSIEFVIEKGKFYDRHQAHLNERQKKVIERIFREGLDGFEGGLSASNYIRITQTSAATATRDLNDLVAKEAFRKTGERKSARYWIEL